MKGLEVCLCPAVDGQGLGERSRGVLRPAVDGQGLGERSRRGLNPVVDGQVVGERSRGVLFLQWMDKAPYVR